MPFHFFCFSYRLFVEDAEKVDAEAKETEEEDFLFIGGVGSNARSKCLAVLIMLVYIALRREPPDVEYTKFIDRPNLDHPLFELITSYPPN